MNWIGTCSIDHPKDWHVTFARSKNHITRLDGTKLNLLVYIPMELDVSEIKADNVFWEPSTYFEYEFALFHNEINKDLQSDREIRHGVWVCEGIREVNGPDGRKIHLKHIGDVSIGQDVRIGRFTVIQMAVFDSTIIEDRVRIDSHCAIGHNSLIGENTVIASGVGIGGSSVIGKNCWIGGNSYIKNGTRVCDGTVIGCMSAVVRDITEPGVYAGVPAKFIKPVSTNWNF